MIIIIIGFMHISSYVQFSSVNIFEREKSTFKVQGSCKTYWWENNQYWQSRRKLWKQKRKKSCNPVLKRSYPKYLTGNEIERLIKVILMKVIFLEREKKKQWNRKREKREINESNLKKRCIWVGDSNRQPQPSRENLERNPQTISRKKSVTTTKRKMKK